MVQLVRLEYFTQKAYVHCNEKLSWPWLLAHRGCLSLDSVPWPWRLAMRHWQRALALAACHERRGVGRTSKPSSCHTRASWPPCCHYGPRGRACGLRCKTLCGFGAFGPLCQHTKWASSLYPHTIAAPVCALPCPLDKPWPLGGIDIDKECYLVDLVSRVSLLLIILCERFINPMQILFEPCGLP